MLTRMDYVRGERRLKANARIMLWSTERVPRLLQGGEFGYDIGAMRTRRIASRHGDRTAAARRRRCRGLGRQGALSGPRRRYLSDCFSEARSPGRCPR
jgi:hypothetical protein